MANISPWHTVSVELIASRRRRKPTLELHGSVEPRLKLPRSCGKPCASLWLTLEHDLTPLSIN